MDKRLPLHSLLERMCNSGIDVLLLNTPSTFSGKIFTQPELRNEVIDSSNVLLSNENATFYGDQDYEPNHGIYLLNSYLNWRGVRSVALDINLLCFLMDRGFNIDPMQIVNTIMLHAKPRIVAISAMLPNLHLATQICADMKKSVDYMATFVLGGIATSDRVACERSEFDVIIDEIDMSRIADIFSHLLNQVSSVPTRYVMRQGIRIMSSAYDDTIINYDDIPREIPLIPRIFTAFGCGNRCEFCSPAAYNNANVYMRSPATVIREIDYIHQKYDFEWFLFGDLTLFLASESVRRIMEALETRSIRPWWCQTQARYISAATARMLALGKCRQVAIGIEDLRTGDRAIRAKNSGLDRTIDACNLLKRMGISVQGYWMFGMPTDTWDNSIEKINDMVTFARSGLIDAFHISYFIPYIGTSYADDSEKYQIKLKDINYAQLLGDQAGYYNSIPMHSTKHLTAHEIYLLTRVAALSCSNEFRKLSTRSKSESS